MAFLGSATVRLLDIDLLRHRQRIIDLGPEVTHRALEIGVTEQQLYGSEVFCASVDKHCFGASQRVRSVGARVQADRSNPVIDDSRILPG